jgi:ferrous iron transport protein A
MRTPVPRSSSEPIALTELPRNVPARVAGVRAGDAEQALALRLLELGFIEGEPLRVVAFGQPGSDPIGVRLGGRGGAGAFALRRSEAALVWVHPGAHP